MAKTLKFAALTLGLSCAAQVMAADLTAISFGGANKQAQVKAFYEPFEKASGHKVLAGEYNGEMAKVKAMVDTNSVTWNLVEVESPEALGLEPGYLLHPAVLDLCYQSFIDFFHEPIAAGNGSVYLPIKVGRVELLRVAPVATLRACLRRQHRGSFLLHDRSLEEIGIQLAP